MFVTAFALFSTVKANPSFFVRQNNGTTTTASTTVTYMTAGTATTTKYFDAGVAGAQAVDNAVFLTQLTGSSTGAVLNVAFEYAMPTSGADCIATPTACDWYADALFANTNASSTQKYSINNANAFALTFASTTQGGAAGRGDGRILRAVTVPTPTRYVRAVMTLPSGSTNGAVWGEFTGKRQAN